MKNRKKRGYSLVEVVIALTVIVTVSITALTIVLSSVATKQTAIHKTEAQNFAQSVWECFKVSDNEADFVSNVDFAEGVTLSDGTLDEDGYTVYTFDSEENKFTAIIKVRYYETLRSDLSVDILDKDGDSIVSFTYQKGDGI